MAEWNKNGGLFRHFCPYLIAENHANCLSGYKFASVAKWNDCPINKLSYKTFSCIFWHVNISRNYIHFKLSFVVRGKQNLNSEVLVSLLNLSYFSNIINLLGYVRILLSDPMKGPYRSSKGVHDISLEHYRLYELI